LADGKHGQDAHRLAVLDTSVLLNFLRVGRLDLLVDLPGHEFLVTDHVRGEVTDTEHSATLNKVLQQHCFRETTGNAPEEVGTFGQLTAVRVLGIGECAALALAVCRNLAIAIDDRTRRRRPCSVSSASLARKTS
jgi:predicted nucleic acid-binding protein